MKAPSSLPKVLRRRRRGFILLAVLIFALLLAMIAVSLLFRFQAEETTSAATATSEQAWNIALSGVQEALRVAAAAAPGSTDWQDNRRLFRERLVYDDGVDRWYFTVFSLNGDDAMDEVRFGLTDEASKLNVNSTHADNLARLPRITPVLVQSLRDFVDPDQDVRAEGAEQDYYAGLPRAYAVRNGPLATLDEIRLVRGFTPSVFAGEDANQNGRLDPNEDDGGEHYPPDNNDGRLDHGYRQYFTVVSYDPEVDNQGARRINLNDPRANLGGLELPPPFSNYLAAVRSTRQTIAHPAHLLEATVRTKDNSGREVEVHSGIGKEELALVLDRFTGRREATQPGLINVNTASVTVLATVPGVDEPLAEAIVSTRTSISPERRETLAWLVQEGVVEAARFKEIAPYLTARAFQFSFQVIGYSVPSGQYRVVEAIVDVAGGERRVVYLRDRTRFGLPFPVGAPAGEMAPSTETAAQPSGTRRVAPKGRLILRPNLHG